MSKVDEHDNALAIGTAQNVISIAHSVSKRAIILQASGMWLMTRLIFVAFTYMAVLFANSPTPVRSFASGALLETWNHGDTGFFLAIANYGYYGPVATPFYPLYPLLIHLVSRIVGYSHQLIAALLISNLGTLVAFVGLGILAVQNEGREGAAGNMIRVVASYPLAFFLIAPYSEGIFLAFATWTLVFMRKGAWYWAAGCAFAAGLTRPIAIILILPLLWEYGLHHQWWVWLCSNWRIWQWKLYVYYQHFLQPGKKQTCIMSTIQALVVVGAVPLSIAFYSLYCQIRFGNPWVFIQSEQYFWLRRSMPPWEAVAVIFSEYNSLPMWTFSHARFLVDAIPLALFTLLTLITIRRMPFSYTLYMFGLLYLCITMPIINGPFPFALMSVGRFLTVSIPIFLLFSRWIERRPWLDMLVVGGGFMLQGLLTAFYLEGGWIV